MKFPPIDLRMAHSIEEALTLLAALGSDAQILAGGQSLLPLLRYRVVRPHVLVDINRIDSLRQLDHSQSIQIGALVRHSELERATESGASLTGLMRRHARDIAFWPVRTRGTAVGSVVQADPKGDWPLLFCAADARVHLRSARGQREEPVRSFLRGPLDTSRQVDELITDIRISPLRANPRRSGRSKLVHRAGEYAMCSSIVLQYDTGWESWLGATGDKPVPLPTLAAHLDSQGASHGRATLVDAAITDIRANLPELLPVQALRHASNAVDAVIDALHETPRSQQHV